MFEEEEEARRASRAALPAIGGPLHSLSVSELEEYLARLQAEIARVEAEKAKRRDVRSAAEELFRKPRP